MARAFKKFYKQIEIEIYYIYGDDDSFSMVLTSVKSILKKKVFLFFSKKISVSTLCDGENDHVTSQIIKNHLRDYMIESTGTDSLFPYKIKWVKGFDSGRPWEFEIYYNDRKNKLGNTIKSTLNPY